MCFDHPESATTGPIAPKDVLTGYAVGGSWVGCTICHRELRAGMDVTVYAYSLVDAPAWDVARIYCTTCAPLRIETPTLGAIEVLADATLATQSRPDTQQHRLCLVSVGIAAHAGPETGSPP